MATENHFIIFFRAANSSSVWSLCPSVCRSLGAPCGTSLKGQLWIVRRFCVRKSDKGGIQTLLEAKSRGIKTATWAPVHREKGIKPAWPLKALLSPAHTHLLHDTHQQWSQASISISAQRPLGVSSLNRARHSTQQKPLRAISAAHLKPEYQEMGVKI